MTTEDSEPRDASLNLLRLYLFGVGGVTLLAFVAAVMPSQWMVEIGEALGFEPFPESPLLYYLARNLSLVYGLLGIAALSLGSDLVRYRPLVRVMAFSVIAFGVMQLVVDMMAEMPLWWTLLESIFAVLGGAILWWLDVRAAE